MSDLISRQAAIDCCRNEWEEEVAERIEALPPASTMGQVDEAVQSSAQPEQPTEVQDILQYLDEYLHPIVSPDHWSVYSELYDMVSMLPSAQPERKKGKWIYDGDCYICDQCKSAFGWWADSQTSNYCPNCGADMRGEQDG